MATSKKKNISREELRALMPKKLNKLGEWFFSNDEDKLYVEVKDMRAVLRWTAIISTPTYSTLPLFDEHRDPNDRLIIAQAISDKIALVSSDRKFDMYEKYGLEFVFNRR